MNHSTSIRYETPQTEDGWVVEVEPVSEGLLNVELRFDISDAFRERCAGLWPHVRFVTRSRIARLGIDIRPATPLEVGTTTASLRATVQALVQAYPVKQYLSELVVKGLPVGRLVLCDPRKRLSGDAVYQAVTEHLFQLPAPLSIDAEGRLTIRPHRCTYELPGTIDKGGLLEILTREDGKAVLDRLQTRREVDNILLKPGDGVITSCTMFLHTHFALLDARSEMHGQHLGATILDPVTTRGTRIFLEFANRSDKLIVNPEVLASVYAADEVHFTPRRWFGGLPDNRQPSIENPGEGSDYHDLAVFFRAEPFNQVEPSYEDRPLAVITDMAEARATGRPQLVEPTAERPEDGFPLKHRTELSGVEPSSGIAVLKELAPGARATVLLEYFPNLIEHLHFCQAALDRRIQRIVFRKASFEHGAFLSSRDHGRLADYEAFGAEVIWLNEVFEETAMHVYRGARGFFVPFRYIEPFRSSLVFAIYGSTLPLSEKEFDNLKTLLERLQSLFGGHVAFLTGGGPGAMRQAADIADRLGLMVGSNYLEIVDQDIQRSVQFYQTFQGTARHFRQRWFDIASFHVFCIGGVGTMEEIGLTLTDMKLGVIERGPLVFFGSTENGLYWDNLKHQLDEIVKSGRGPSWLETNVLMTDDPDQVISFYERILEIGVQHRQ